MIKKKEGKKGQVTTFIIIGISLLIIIAFILFLRDWYAEKTLEAAMERAPLPPEVAPISNYVDLCLQKVLTPGVFLLGAQGGYVYPPEDVLLTQYAAIAYGSIDGENTLQLPLAIEAELANYVEASLTLCLYDFSEFTAQGFVIEKGRPKATIRIAQDFVTAVLDYPLTVRKGETTYELRSFAARTPIRLMHILDVANNVVTTINQNPNDVNFHDLSLYDTYVTVLPYDEENIIYSIRDTNSTVDDAEFTFMFATKDLTRNTAPILDYIQNFVLKKGKAFSYQATAVDGENDYLMFYTNNPEFPIDPETGEITITPQTPGTYLVAIGVRDKKGLTDEQEVRFIVENV